MKNVALPETAVVSFRAGSKRVTSIKMAKDAGSMPHKIKAFCSVVFLLFQ